MTKEITEKVLNIKVDHDRAVHKIAEYREALTQATIAEKQNAEQLKRGEITQREYLDNISLLKIEEQQYKDAIRTLNKELNNEIKMQGDAATSLKGMRAELSNLVAKYDSLSKAQRDATEGQQLQQQIANLTNEIKENEYATERYFRNVGNYPQAMGHIKDVFMQTYTATGSLEQGFIAAGAAAQKLGKKLWSMISGHPILAAIAGVVAIVMSLVNAMKRSEEQQERLSQVTAAFTPIVNAVKNAISYLAEGVLVAAEAMAWLADKMGLVGEKSKETIAIEKERIALTRADRDNLVKSAETENAVAKLRDKVAQKDKYNAAQRKAFLEHAIALEKEQSRTNKELAKRRLANLEREAALTKNNAEMNQKLAEAKAAVIKADTDYYNTTIKLQKQLANFNEQEHAAAQKSTEDAKRAAEERKRAREEQARKEMEILQQAEDAMIALVKDAYLRETQAIEKQYEREIEILRKKATEMPKMQEQINIIILAKEQERDNKLAELDKKHVEEMQKASDETTTREMKQRAKRLALAIEAAQKGSYEELQAKRDANAQAYEMQLAEIDKENATDEWKYEQKKLALEAYLQKQNELTKAYSEKNAEEQAKVAEKEKQIQQSKIDFAETTLKGLSNLMAAFGDDNKAMAKLSKVLALGEIAVNTGKALAAGIAQAQSVPFPANIAAIATTTATILANVASAVSAVKSAKFAHGGVVGNYATGGSVVGAGTATSDSIPARLSNGESVLTAAATQMFSPILSAFNQIGGGVPINVASNGTQAIGEEMLARAVARGVAAMPAPVVSVEEINTTANRVKVLESLATL